MILLIDGCFCAGSFVYAPALPRPCGDPHCYQLSSPSSLTHTYTKAVCQPGMLVAGRQRHGLGPLGTRSGQLLSHAPRAATGRWEGRRLRPAQSAQPLPHPLPRRLSITSILTLLFIFLSCLHTGILLACSHHPQSLPAKPSTKQPSPPPPHPSAHPQIRPLIPKRPRLRFGHCHHQPFVHKDRLQRIR